MGIVSDVDDLRDGAVAGLACLVMTETDVILTPDQRAQPFIAMLACSISGIDRMVWVRIRDDLSGGCGLNLALPH
jgi:hypothetical protein